MLTWCMIPMPGGTILNSSRAVCPHLRKRYRSLLRAYSSSTLRSRASGRPKTAAVTEGAAPGSAGIPGFTVGGVIPPPHRLDLLGRDHLPVLVPQQVLQQHLRVSGSGATPTH